MAQEAACLDIVPVTGVQAVQEELRGGKNALALRVPAARNPGAEELCFLLRTLDAHKYLSKMVKPNVAGVLSSLLSLNLRMALANERRYLALLAPPDARGRRAADKAAAGMHATREQQVHSPRGLMPLPLPGNNAAASPTAASAPARPSVQVEELPPTPKASQAGNQELDIPLQACSISEGSTCRPQGDAQQQNGSTFSNTLPSTMQVQKQDCHDSGKAACAATQDSTCLTIALTRPTADAVSVCGVQGTEASQQAAETASSLQNQQAETAGPLQSQQAETARPLGNQQADTATPLEKQTPSPLKQQQAETARQWENQPLQQQQAEGPQQDERYAPDCIKMGVYTAMGQRTSMEDFAFAMPLTRPDAAGCWFKLGACFGVFDGHGGHEVAQSLAEHVPGEIRTSLHNFAKDGGPQLVGQILLSHERRLRSDSNLWAVYDRNPSRSHSPSHVPHSHSTVFSNVHGSESSSSLQSLQPTGPGLRRNPHSAGSALGSASSAMWQPHRLQGTVSGGILDREHLQWQPGAGDGAERATSWHAEVSVRPDSAPPVEQAHMMKAVSDSFAADILQVVADNAGVFAPSPGAVPHTVAATESPTSGVRSRTISAMASAACSPSPLPCMPTLDAVDVSKDRAAGHLHSHAVSTDSPKGSPSVSRPPLHPHGPRTSTRTHISSHVHPADTPHGGTSILDAATLSGRSTQQQTQQRTVHIEPGETRLQGTVSTSPPLQSAAASAFLQGAVAAAAAAAGYSPTKPHVAQGPSASSQQAEPSIKQQQVPLPSSKVVFEWITTADSTSTEGLPASVHPDSILLPPEPSGASAASLLRGSSISFCDAFRAPGSASASLTQENGQPLHPVARALAAELQAAPSATLMPELQPTQSVDVRVEEDGMVEAVSRESGWGPQAASTGSPAQPNGVHGNGQGSGQGAMGSAASSAAGSGPPAGPTASGQWDSWASEDWEQLMQGRDPGSTALVATIFDSAMYVANVGDCRLILAELDEGTGRVVPRPVTVDHVPDRHQGEAARLAALQVPVSKDGYVGHGGGFLQVSRSIGDFSTKVQLGEQVILSEPELHSVHLKPSCLFAVAASDGITCAMSDDTIVNQVCKYLNEGGPTGAGNDPQHAAEQLVQYAINAANSADNASVVITCFKHSKPPVPQRPRLFGAGRGQRRDSAPAITVP